MLIFLIVSFLYHFLKMFFTKNVNFYVCFFFIFVKGVTEDGRTYLDQFRQLVTEIGNALGYVRMVWGTRSGGDYICFCFNSFIFWLSLIHKNTNQVRSGILNTVSSAIKFVPDLSHIVPFLQHATEAQFSGDTLAATKYV